MKLNRISLIFASIIIVPSVFSMSWDLRKSDLEKNSDNLGAGKQDIGSKSGDSEFSKIVQNTKKDAHGELEENLISVNQAEERVIKAIRDRKIIIPEVPESIAQRNRLNETANGILIGVAATGAVMLLCGLSIEGFKAVHSYLRKEPVVQKPINRDSDIEDSFLRKFGGTATCSAVVIAYLAGLKTKSPKFWQPF